LLDVSLPPTRVQRDDAGRVWYCGLPDPEELAAKVLDNADWFMSLTEDRESAFFEIRKHSQELYETTPSLDKSELVNSVRGLLSQWIAQHEKVYHLVLFNAMVVDVLGDRFFNFLIGSIGNRLALEHVTELFATPYAAEAKEKGHSFVAHSNDHSSTPIRIASASTNLSPRSRHEKEVVDAILSLSPKMRGNVWKQYSQMRISVPVLVQLNDEQAYIWRTHSLLVMRTMRQFEKWMRERRAGFRLDDMAAIEVLDLLDGLK